MTLKFMGQQFADVAALKREFPAFASDDAVRAIRAGCETVMEVERFCWERRNAAYRRSVDGAKKSGYGRINKRDDEKRKREAAKRGGKSTKATRANRRKKAA